MNTNPTTLTAMWFPPRTYPHDEPSIVFWDDLSVSTYDEYRAHQEDTQWIQQGSDGTELLMYADLAAEARFDYSIGLWLVSGLTSEPLTLDLDDPAAADEDITAELFSRHFSYRLSIVRGKLPPRRPRAFLSNP